MGFLKLRMASFSSTSSSLRFTSSKFCRIRATLAGFLEVMSALHRSIRSLISSPASKSRRRTALSVTSSSTRAMGRRCRPTSFWTYFIFSFSGIFSFSKILGTIRAPTTSCPWKVQPTAGSKRLVMGFPMSCSRAAHRSQRFRSWSAAATLSSTCNVCEKFSLWPRPSTVSTPFSFSSSGRI